MIIEKAGSNDLPRLLELYSDLFGHDCMPSAEILQRYETLLQQENYTLLTAKEDTQILGTALVILCQGITENFLVIEDVVVDAAARGKGVGNAIFSEIDQIAAKLNCAYAILVSSGFRKGAHKFYQKMGYNDDALGFRKVYFAI